MLATGLLVRANPPPVSLVGEGRALFLQSDGVAPACACGGGGAGASAARALARILGESLVQLSARPAAMISFLKASLKNLALPPLGL
jgi:hypothetical protein